MKKAVLMLLTLFTVCSLAACSKPDQKTSVEPAATTEADAKTHETTTPPAEQTAPGDTSEFKILKAKVLEISDSMSDITVEADGKALKFDLGSAVVETSYAVDIDSVVNVVYKGEVSGTDTSNAKVILVLDAQDAMAVQTITGNVTGQAMSAFTLELDNRETMGFLKDNCEGMSSDVMGSASGESNASGARVKVTYVTVTYDAGSEGNYPLKIEAVK